MTDQDLIYAMRSLLSNCDYWRGSLPSPDMAGDDLGVYSWGPLIDAARQALNKAELEHGLILTAPRKRSETGMTTFTYRHAGPATECETCETCGESVPVDQFLGNDCPDGTREYLCSDCYIPDPQGNFQTPGD